MITPTPEDDFPRLTADPADIIASVFSQDRRALLFGAPGTGKSTLVTRLAEQFAQLRRGCWCISADPGSPLMGVPGAVTLGHWQHDGWLTVEYFALCTLDAGRLRLPLVSTLRRLTEQFRDGVILVDGPGVARGVAGRELLEGLVEATRAEPRLHQELAVQQGVIREDAGFRIRAVLLDHQGIEVVAYAFEPAKQINVRKDRLVAQGLKPGPWLGELKQQLLRGNETAGIRLPDGSDATVAALAAELLLLSPGKKLVYATDLADTADNRKRLIDLAQRAHTLLCEASFVEAQAEHALRNGHLTTVSCGEIAMQAGVARLVPFHFSRRYSTDPRQLYDGLKTACSRVVIPPSMRLFDDADTTPGEDEVELD